MSDNLLRYNNIFKEVGYVKVPKLVNDQTIRLISRYFEYSINNPITQIIANYGNSDLGLYWGHQQQTNDPSSKISRYSDPFIEALLYELKPNIEIVTGKELFPTYSFSRVYMSGDELAPHTDRPACEYSVTISVAYKNIEDCPIMMQKEGCERSQFTLSPGDAVVYEGCNVHHWREPLADNGISVQFMLHYVDANGEFSNYKYDKRKCLGTYERIN